MAVGFSRDMWYNYIADRSHPPVASAIVEKPEYDPDHVYAWKPANNYKGWKRIDKGEAGVDDAEVIQSAINDTDEYGLVVVICNVTLTSTLVIDKKVNVDFYGKITADGITAIKLGNQDTTKLTFIRIKLNELDGISKATGTYGIEVENAAACKVYFGKIRRFDKGIYFDPKTSGDAGENRFFGGNITECNVGIGFSTSSQRMQGNIIECGIFACSKGLEYEAGGNSYNCMFRGVIHCEGGQDIVDNVGLQIFIPYYLQKPVEDYSTIHHKSTLVGTVDLFQAYSRARINSQDGANGIELDADNGYIELWSDVVNPAIEFKDNRDADYNARIEEINKQLKFIVGGKATPKTALLLEADGHVNASNYGIKTKYFVDDYGGNFANFTPPAGEDGLIIIAIDTNSTNPGKRLYVYANGEWHYVDLT